MGEEGVEEIVCAMGGWKIWWLGGFPEGLAWASELGRSTVEGGAEALGRGGGEGETGGLGFEPVVGIPEGCSVALAEAMGAAADDVCEIAASGGSIDGGEKEAGDGVDGGGGGVVVEVGECMGEEGSEWSFDGWQGGGGDAGKREGVDFMEGVRVGGKAVEECAVGGEVVNW